MSPINIHIDPVKSTGVFYRHGVTWYVQSLLFNGAAKTKEEIAATFQAYIDESDSVLSASEVLRGLDLETESGAAAAWELVKDSQHLPEYWAAIVGGAAQHMRNLLGGDDIEMAVWVTHQLTNAHAMMVYTRDVERLTWSGYRARLLGRTLAEWEANHENASEEFWQKFFVRNVFTLSQIFAFPVVILQSKAYVGGKAIDNTGGALADFVVQNALTENVGVVEIKTPTTRLLGSVYRAGVYGISSDIAGAITQVSRYKDSLLKEFYAEHFKSAASFQAFEPEGIVIGGLLEQIDSDDRRASFELFRANLRHVRILTFDEVFRKVSALVALVDAEAAPA